MNSDVARPAAKSRAYPRPLPVRHLQHATSPGVVPFIWGQTRTGTEVDRAMKS